MAGPVHAPLGGGHQVSAGWPVRGGISSVGTQNAGAGSDRDLAYVTFRSNPSLPTGNRLLATLPPAELDMLRPFMTRVRLVADQVLIEHGRPAEHVYFVEDGLASLVAETEYGRSGVQVAMIGREGMVGGLALLDSESAAYAAAVMHIPGPALRISTAHLRQCLENSAVLRETTLRFVQSMTRQVMSIAASNARNSLAERCVFWLLMAHDRVEGDDLRVTQQALSVMLGVRRSGVTVATAALQKAGLIRSSRGHIRIVDRPGLEALARGGARGGADQARMPLPPEPVRAGASAQPATAGAGAAFAGGGARLSAALPTSIPPIAGGRGPALTESRGASLAGNRGTSPVFQEKVDWS